MQAVGNREDVITVGGRLDRSTMQVIDLGAVYKEGVGKCATALLAK